MKVLVVCREKLGLRPYITEQVEAIREKGVEIEYFFISGKGILSYLTAYKAFIGCIRKFTPEIIHAHYGLSGLFANLQRKIPVITTYHGSDINFRRIRPFSMLASRLSKYNIYVSIKLATLACSKKNYQVIPCGIDLDKFYPIDKKLARERLELDHDIVTALFSGSFTNKIKNATLAFEAIKRCHKNIDLIELKDYSREEVNLLFSASDFALMTSLMEGSPQFIKEAMACNCPIVSTRVGTVAEIINDTEGCYITSFDAGEVCENFSKAIHFGRRTNGREKMALYDNRSIADKIINLYKSTIREKA